MAEKRSSARSGAAGGRVRIPAHLRPRPALDYQLDKKPEHRVLWVLRSLTPGLDYLTTKYSRRWLRADSVAGVAVAAYLIPQVMAYSAIVNVPPVASLWAALAAIVGYVVLGSSRILSSGPESTIALMTGVAIAPLAAQNPERAVALSAALALIVAGWALVARLLRAGIVAELLSTPLLVGYLAGGAVLMVVGQLAKVTGTSFEGDTIIEDLRGFLGVATRDRLADDHRRREHTGGHPAAALAGPVASRPAHRGGAGHDRIGRVRPGLVWGRAGRRGAFGAARAGAARRDVRGRQDAPARRPGHHDRRLQRHHAHRPGIPSRPRRRGDRGRPSARSAGRTRRHGRRTRDGRRLQRLSGLRVRVADGPGHRRWRAQPGLLAGRRRCASSRSCSLPVR